jgi:glutamate racemase
VKVGVFDSGFGGLTVLRALLPLLPGAEFLYLGDTARLPYGSKSRATIVRYAVSSTRFLLDQGAEFLVIACNTASALALKEIRASTQVPVLGVIETGADEAAASSKTPGRAESEAFAPSRRPAHCWCRWWKKVGSIIQSRPR